MDIKCEFKLAYAIVRYCNQDKYPNIYYYYSRTQMESIHSRTWAKALMSYNANPANVGGEILREQPYTAADNTPDKTIGASRGRDDSMSDNIWELIYRINNKWSKWNPSLKKMQLAIMVTIVLAPVMSIVKSHVPDEYMPVSNVIAATVIVVCGYILWTTRGDGEDNKS